METIISKADCASAPECRVRMDSIERTHLDVHKKIGKIFDGLDAHIKADTIAHERTAVVLAKNTETSIWVVRVGSFVIGIMLLYGVYIMNKTEENKGSIQELNVKSAERGASISSDIKYIKRMLNGDKI